VTLQFVIPGPPVGKQRARTFRHKQSGRILSMTPSKTVNYEALVKQTFAAKYPNFVPLRRAVEVILAIYLAPSQAEARSIAYCRKVNANRYKNQKRPPEPTKKPDIDNVTKAFLDALSGLAYFRDQQVVHLDIWKYWAKEAPRVEVIINGEQEQTISRGEAA